MKGVVCNLRITVKDAKSGAIISQREDRAHSFVRNFMQMIYHSFDGSSNSGYKNSEGNAQSAAFTYIGYSGGILCIAGAGVVDRGIIVGTSNTAFDISQYTLLQAIIPNGTSAGQMAYTAMLTPGEPVFSDPNILLTLSRDIANNSGGSITVREIGLAGRSYSSGTVGGGVTGEHSILIARDVVSDTVVAAGQVLNVQYIFKTVVE
jgi:hypothetical protein